MDDWRDFQSKVAEIFREIGADVQVEARVRGARAIHRVDVLVEFKQFGLPVRWVVECKCWRSSVPKEKVMTLQAVVADVGADKGLLVSQVGFQRGAAHAARGSNVELYTLEGLSALTRMDVTRAALERLDQQVLGMRAKLLKLTVRLDDGSNPGVRRSWTPYGATEGIGLLAILEMGLGNAKLGTPPYVYPELDDDSVASTSELAAFLREAAVVVAEAEANYLAASKIYYSDESEA